MQAGYQLRAVAVDPRKSVVQRAYDQVVDTWGQARRTAAISTRESTWVERFHSALPSGASVLDLGCGSGAPILLDVLRRGHRVVGVDFSREQLLGARIRCPQALLVQADIGEVEFAASSFDGIIAYDSLWHLPRDEHPRVFDGIRRWLAGGGTALLTLAVGNGALFTDLMGAPVFYDAWPEATSLRMLGDAGLSVVGHHFQPVEEGGAEGHLIILVANTPIAAPHATGTTRFPLGAPGVVPLRTRRTAKYFVAQSVT